MDLKLRVWRQAGTNAVGAWEYTGDNAHPTLHREPLEFETVHLAQRSYK